MADPIQGSAINFPEFTPQFRDGPIIPDKEGPDYHKRPRMTDSQRRKRNKILGIMRDVEALRKELTLLQAKYKSRAEDVVPIPKARVHQCMITGKIRTRRWGV